MPVNFSVRSNIAEVTRYLTDVQRNQIPYATARALTKTVYQMKTVDVPASMKRAMAAPTRYTMGGVRYKGATKARQKASVYIDGGRLKYLRHPATGEDRLPRTFGYVMVPVGLERQAGTGRVLSPRLARSYRAQLLAKPDYFEATVRSTTGIWQRVGEPGPRGGAARHIRLAVLYLPRTEYAQTWGFYEAIARRAGSVFSYELNGALVLALRTARER